MYDPAVGRFTGVDPISDKFPHVSTYNYAENEPIANIDLHGLQKHRMVDGSTVTGPVSPEVLENKNTEIVANQLIAQNENSEITELGLAEVESRNPAQGEGIMQIFSPENVGLTLGLYSPSKLPTSRAFTFTAPLARINLGSIVKRGLEKAPDWGKSFAGVHNTKTRQSFIFKNWHSNTNVPSGFLPRNGAHVRFAHHLAAEGKGNVSDFVGFSMKANTGKTATINSFFSRGLNGRFHGNTQMGAEFEKQIISGLKNRYQLNKINVKLDPR